MKRGFINTSRRAKTRARYNKARTKSLSQEKPLSPPQRTSRGDEKAPPDTMDVDKTASDDAYVSSLVYDRGRWCGTVRAPDGVRVRRCADGHIVMVTKRDIGAKSDLEKKGEEAVVHVGDDAVAVVPKQGVDLHDVHVPPRPLPRRRGWGRGPKEDFFHTVPGKVCRYDRQRAVFCVWPRDSDGKPLPESDNVKGTLSPDGYPWAATLYDLYFVDKVPGDFGDVSTVTGSMMSEMVKELGEGDARVAANLITWAKSEGKPRNVGVADTEELIRRVDLHLRMRFEGACRRAKCVQEETKEDDEKTLEPCDIDKEGTLPNYIPQSQTIPVTSPFHRDHYTGSWPFVPFNDPYTILLQERIPLYLLPQKLHVHDPFDLLTAKNQTYWRDTSWTSRPDIVRTYDLCVSDSISSDVEEARRKAKELEEFKARSLIILRYQRTKEQIDNHEPVIEVRLPPYVRRPTQVEESHLYLSPIAGVGKGHHSVVYKAEWELPRDIFMKPQICPLCFKASVDKEIQAMKDAGRWEELMRSPLNGDTGHEPTLADLDACHEPPKLICDEKIIEREITCVVSPNSALSRILEMVYASSETWVKLMNERDVNTHLIRYADENESTDDPHVPVVRVNVPFSYESQRSCIHEGPRVPRMAKFTVVAKLSFKYDLHLAREAVNYQSFPEHFFHHYDGYSVISQLRAIVPVGAVVPQFYGYYKPREEEQWEYLSPILLMEHCGTQINPYTLSQEEQEECASLILRFQRAGWLHESIWPRNMLIQRGKPSEFPSVRECKREASFRLIDFGRSRKYETVHEKSGEEREVKVLFYKLYSRMTVTLCPRCGLS